MQAPSDAEKSRFLWTLILLQPSRLEKSRLAWSLRLSEHPSAEWAIASWLLWDQDHDVVGNAVNATSFSGVRALTQRTNHFYFDSKKPQRILYCMARHTEMNCDQRQRTLLSSCLDKNHSDAFLARTFNALYRLGVQDENAIEVALELMKSHVGATNMDRKAAVSATLYLFFSCGLEVLDKVKKIGEEVTIPELKRLLRWGFADLERTSQNGFNVEDAKAFFRRGFGEEEPNFTGYGCFEQKVLNEAFQFFLDGDEIENGCLIGTALSLGNVEIIHALLNHPKRGLLNAIDKNLKEELDIWLFYMPVHCPEFEKVFTEPKYFDAFYNVKQSAYYGFLGVSHLNQKPWIAKFEEFLKAGDVGKLSVLLCCKYLCLEGIVLSKDHTNLEKFTTQCKETLEKIISKTKEPEKLQLLTDRLYGVLLGGRFSAEVLSHALGKLPPDFQSWSYLALPITAPKTLPWANIEETILHQFSIIPQELHNPQNSIQDFVSKLSCRLIASCSGVMRWKQPLNEGVIASVQDIVDTAHGIMAALQNPSEKDPSIEHNDVGDWRGYVAVDSPLQRWSTILKVCAERNSDDPKFDKEQEDTLKTALRVSPHVEKRWVVIALIALDSTDAIKAILYQSFQHVDIEFVIHTIKQLLHSHHPRAQQALIRCVGRNSIPDGVKLKILEEISLDSPQDVLTELKTLEILRLPQHIDEAVKDALGRVSECLESSKVQEKQKHTENMPQGIQKAGEVDATIKRFIPEMERLSVDTRSALRTAEMILIQSQDWGEEGVDLSPIVNMHCKAVELTMREVFEPYTDAVIRKGGLSNKLDILGYARPIPEKMQIFEDYLASLPVIKTIPYFSKFKLRKMLRAICLYRPGKRFTLDGPKAFALFMLVTARKEDQFNLAKTIVVGFESDKQLFEFIKLVHSLQDSRNRAVHEGLTWEAQEEIEKMRNQAYEIIKICLDISKFLSQNWSDGSVKKKHDSFAKIGA